MAINMMMNAFTHFKMVRLYSKLFFNFYRFNSVCSALIIHYEIYNIYAF